jgi:predicted ArsR family transcriptional regulator
MMMLEDQTATLRVPCLHALPDAQRAIIEVLHEAGDVAISRIGNELGVTPSAVRSRLVRLTKAGLVTATIEKCGTRGRPRHQYGLTMSARSLFSTRGNEDASAFALDVLREVRRRDPELVADVVNDLSAAPARAGRSRKRHEMLETRVSASAS